MKYAARDAGVPKLFHFYFALAVLCSPEQVHAQFTDPRTYDNTPVGVNQIEVDYAYVHSDASIDTSLIVAGAKFNLNVKVIDYARYFGFVHRLAWVEASVPVAGLNGSITSTNIRGSITGTGDSSYQVAILLKGGPALSVPEFASYKSATTVGVSLTVTAPTGLYHPDKLLNLGSHRWSFKPEIAVSLPFGPEQKWEFNAYGNVYFFTDNTSYQSVKILRQEVLPGLEGHISYSFSNSVWASVDMRYSFRGDTFINGMDQTNSQQNFTLGSELNVSLNAHNALVCEFAKPLLHKNGPTYTGFAVKYSYSWSKGHR